MFVHILYFIKGHILNYVNLKKRSAYVKYLSHADYFSKDLD